MQTPNVYDQVPQNVEDAADREPTYTMTCLDLTGFLVSAAGRCLATIKEKLGVRYQQSRVRIEDWVVVEVEPEETFVTQPTVIGQRRHRST